MGGNPDHVGSHVVGEVSCRCGGGHAEKENTGGYEQVCDCGEENRLKLLRLKAIRFTAFTNSPQSKCLQSAFPNRLQPNLKKRRNKMRDHKKLKAFQLADEVALSIYRITRVFPKEELFGLTSQMRRAAVSACSSNSLQPNRLQAVFHSACFFPLLFPSISLKKKIILILI